MKSVRKPDHLVICVNHCLDAKRNDAVRKRMSDIDVAYDRQVWVINYVCEDLLI